MKTRFAVLACLAVLLLCSGDGASAQPGNDNPNNPCNTPQPAGTSSDPELWRTLSVVEECVARSPNGDRAVTVRTTTKARLGDEVDVAVRGLAQFDAVSAPLTEVSEGALGSKANPKVLRLVLYVDNKPLAVPVVSASPALSTVRFALVRTAANRDDWRRVLAAVRGRAVSLSVGVQGEGPVASTVHDFELSLLSSSALITGILYLSVLVMGVVVLAAKSNLVRQDSESTWGPPPYSLERTLTLAWSFAILLCCGITWITTKDTGPTSSTLLLLGISVTTTLAGTMLGPVDPSDLRGGSAGFYHDILRGERGVNLANLLCAGWNLFLILLIIHTTYQELTVPEIGTSLVAATAISNAMYLGSRVAKPLPPHRGLAQAAEPAPLRPVDVAGQNPASHWPSIFMCYRRDDSSYVADRIHNQLVSAFTRERVFRDIDNVAIGQDFLERINDSLSRCDVVLVLIGPRWLETDVSGHRRLDDPDDVVRLEIEAGLAQGLRIIPVLVANGKMPKASDLPASMAALTKRSAAQVRPDPDYTSDMERLLAALRARGD